jgi:hypothetical protein
MITRARVPRRRTALEIAIAVSIAIHVLFGGMLVPLSHLLRAPQARPTESPIVALSDVITIDKRKTVPEPHPVVQPKPAVPQKPAVVVTQAEPAVPKPAVHVEKPKQSVAPAHRTERKELAAPKPAQVAVYDNGRPSEGALKGDRGKTDVALAPLQPKVPSTRQGPYTDQQLAALQKQFAQTIAQARTRSDPLAVPSEAPAGQKHFQVQMRGIYGYLRNGEGTITPTRQWSQDGYNYFYMNYETVYSDGVFEQGSIPWPARWPAGEIADIMRPGWHGPMPCPAPGYSFPSLAEWKALKPAVQAGLHLCRPDLYPEPG